MRGRIATVGSGGSWAIEHSPRRNARPPANHRTSTQARRQAVAMYFLQFSLANTHGALPRAGTPRGAIGQGAADEEGAGEGGAGDEAADVGAVGDAAGLRAAEDAEAAD